MKISAVGAGIAAATAGCLTGACIVALLIADAKGLIWVALVSQVVAVAAILKMLSKVS